MVDISNKDSTHRNATASCTMRMPERICRAIFDSTVSINQKGDIISTAKLAGVLAAKKTSELIPLCHQVPLAQVNVEISQLDETSALIRGTAKCVGQTGVEMEALMSVSVAALTVYDMTKSALKGSSDKIVISEIQLDSKSGGSSSSVS